MADSQVQVDWPATLRALAKEHKTGDVAVTCMAAAMAFEVLATQVQPAPAAALAKELQADGEPDRGTALRAIADRHADVLVDAIQTGGIPAHLVRLSFRACAYEAGARTVPPNPAPATQGNTLEREGAAEWFEAESDDLEAQAIRDAKLGLPYSDDADLARLYNLAASALRDSPQKAAGELHKRITSLETALAVALASHPHVRSAAEPGVVFCVLCSARALQVSDVVHATNCIYSLLPQ